MLKGESKPIHCKELSQETVSAHVKKKLHGQSLDSLHPRRPRPCPSSQEKRQLSPCQACQACSNLLNNPIFQTRTLRLGRFSCIITFS